MGKQRNLAVGKVEVPKEYFLRMAKHDYREYRKALPREFYQNSVDAGATEIKVLFNRDLRTVVVKDNGSGMTLDVLKNKLLVLGGSEKRSGSTGAFGKAKELLFFAWEKYEIHTKDLLCQGSGADYVINKTTPFNGTKCTIWIPTEEEYDYYESEFSNVAKKFEVDTSIKINGTTIQCKLLRDQLVRETDWCKVYVNPDATRSWYVHVRVNGQWMFSKYTGDNVGQIIMELSKGSVEMLTSNRDGIKEKYSSQFDDLMREVIVEREEFLRPKPKMVKALIKGAGMVKVNFDRIRKAVSERISKVVYDSGATTLKDIKNVKSLVVDDMDMSEVRLLQLQKMAQLKRDRQLYDVDKDIAFIGYEPDFVLHYDQSHEKEVMSYMKSRKAKILAECWTQVVKQVLLDIDWAGQFIAGFTIGSPDRASFERIEGVPYFTLNPDTFMADLPEVNSPFHNRTMLRHMIVQAACHEVAHESQHYHDNSFVLRFHWVQAQTWKSEEIYKRIITAAFKKY